MRKANVQDTRTERWSRKHSKIASKEENVNRPQIVGQIPPLKEINGDQEIAKPTEAIWANNYAGERIQEESKRIWNLPE